MAILPDDFYSLGSDSEEITRNNSLWVVVPTVRPDSIRNFLDLWRVEDIPGVRFLFVNDGMSVFDNEGILETSWEQIDEILGSGSWIIPRKTDCVRSFGFLMAARMGAKYIISMDDDCFPSEGRPENFFMDHLKILSSGIHPSFSTTGHRLLNMRPRGLPRRDVMTSLPSRRILINHGLWDGQLDLAGDDAVNTMSQFGRNDVPMTWLPPRFDIVPQGFFYPMCGMNVSFSVDMLPAMYFTLQGTMHVDGVDHALDYDRWGDIWCGLFSKIVADNIGGYVSSGTPRVFHSRASSATKNRDKERAGLFLHPKMVSHLMQDGIVKRRDVINFENVGEMYVEIADSLREVGGATNDERAYLILLSEAMKQWVETCLTFVQNS